MSAPSTNFATSRRERNKTTLPRWSEPAWRRLILKHETLIVALLIVAVFAMTAHSPRFASPLTLTYLLLDVAPILLCALPLAFILITGEIDLSIGSAVGFSNVLLGATYAAGLPIIWACVIGVLGGVVVGLVNGVLVSLFRLPSLAVTIGTLALFRGISIGILGTDSITELPVEWKSFANGVFGTSGIPYIAVIMLLAVVVFGTILHFTPFGRAVFAVGEGRETARFSGVNVEKLKFTTFVVSGLIAGLVGVFYTFRYGSARGGNAEGLELAVIAAVVLGGVSIFGGKGRIGGVVASVLLIGLIESFMRFNNFASDVINIVVGSLLTLSVVASLVTAKILNASRTAKFRRQMREGELEKKSGKESS